MKSINEIRQTTSNGLDLSPKSLKSVAKELAKKIIVFKKCPETPS
jgi:hypothetical protein